MEWIRVEDAGPAMTSSPTVYTLCCGCGPGREREGGREREPED